MKIYKCVTGYCPKFDENKTIEVTFQELNLLGQLQPHYKRLGYRCDHEALNGCNVSDENRMCPIYASTSNYPMD